MLKTPSNPAIETAGLAHWYSQLARLTRPAVSIISQTVADHAIAIGQSKLGGEPDLPLGYQWQYYKDRPLGFLAQFNLAEVSPIDQSGLLPKTGLLSFFYDPNQEPWGFDPKDKGGWQVLYTPEGSKLQRTSIPECKDCLFEPEFNSCHLEIQPTPTFPGWEAPAILELGLSEKERVQYYEMTSAGIRHQLMGYAAPLQGDAMDVQSELVSNGIYLDEKVDYGDPKIQKLLARAGDWRLLLQLDSDPNPGFEWGEQGRLYFWIRAGDLRKRDFSRVWLIGQCF